MGSYRVACPQLKRVYVPSYALSLSLSFSLSLSPSRLCKRCGLRPSVYEHLWFTNVCDTYSRTIERSWNVQWVKPSFGRFWIFCDVICSTYTITLYSLIKLAVNQVIVTTVFVSNENFMSHSTPHDLSRGAKKGKILVSVYFHNCIFWWNLSFSIEY